MKTIGIIGASGQVGLEVCLFLATYPDVRVVAIVRAGVSASLLKRLGIEYRTGSLGDPEQCRELLKDLDLIVDFSVRLGDVKDTNSYYHNNITKALAFSKPDAKYVFISSINAFGMSERFNKAKHYVIPHSIYAHTKRYGERLAFQHGRKNGKDTFVFRLGHVHGPLQRVSTETVKLVNGKYEHFIYPDTPSYTVFCFTIAEGLYHVVQGKEKPGNYVLISEPAWSWKEVLEYYVKPGRKIKVELTTARKPYSLRDFVQGIKGGLFSVLTKYKDTLRANILHHFPDVENRNKANLYTQRAASQIGEYREKTIYRPSGIHEGTFPGKRLSSISDSRASMAARTAVVMDRLRAVFPGYAEEVVGSDVAIERSTM